MSGCRNSKLENVRAESINIVDSTVTLENVRVSSNGVALFVKESEIEGTLVILEGEKALKSDGSKIDLAGSSLTGRSDIVEADDESIIYFSVSDGNIEDRIYYLHGDYSSGVP